MAKRTQLLIIGLDQEVLDLLEDARERAERKAGFPITKQAFLRKHVTEVANREKALQDIASEEYAKQQSEGAE